jgi:hypothetical protein
MDENAFFKMVAEECAAAAYARITDAPMEPSTNGSSDELRAYLLKLDDETFLNDEANALIDELKAALPAAPHIQ